MTLSNRAYLDLILRKPKDYLSLPAATKEPNAISPVSPQKCEAQHKTNTKNGLERTHHGISNADRSLHLYSVKSSMCSSAAVTSSSADDRRCSVPFSEGRGIPEQPKERCCCQPTKLTEGGKDLTCSKCATLQNEKDQLLREITLFQINAQKEFSSNLVDMKAQLERKESAISNYETIIEESMKHQAELKSEIKRLSATMEYLSATAMGLREKLAAEEVKRQEAEELLKSFSDDLVTLKQENDRLKLLISRDGNEIKSEVNRPSIKGIAHIKRQGIKSEASSESNAVGDHLGASLLDIELFGTSEECVDGETVERLEPTNGLLSYVRGEQPSNALKFEQIRSPPTKRASETILVNSFHYGLKKERFEDLVDTRVTLAPSMEEKSVLHFGSPPPSKRRGSSRGFYTNKKRCRIDCTQRVANVSIASNTCVNSEAYESNANTSIVEKEVVGDNAATDDEEGAKSSRDSLAWPNYRVDDEISLSKPPMFAKQSVVEYFALALDHMESSTCASTPDCIDTIDYSQNGAYGCAEGEAEESLLPIETVERGCLANINVHNEPSLLDLGSKCSCTCYFSMILLYVDEWQKSRDNREEKRRIVTKLIERLSLILKCAITQQPYKIVTCSPPSVELSSFLESNEQSIVPVLQTLLCVCSNSLMAVLLEELALVGGWAHVDPSKIIKPFGDIVEFLNALLFVMYQSLINMYSELTSQDVSCRLPEAELFNNRFPLLFSSFFKGSKRYNSHIYCVLRFFSTFLDASEPMLQLTEYQSLHRMQSLYVQSKKSSKRNVLDVGSLSLYSSICKAVLLDSEEKDICGHLYARINHLLQSFDDSSLLRCIGLYIYQRTSVTTVDFADLSFCLCLIKACSNQLKEFATNHQKEQVFVSLLLFLCECLPKIDTNIFEKLVTRPFSELSDETVCCIMDGVSTERIMKETLHFATNEHVFMAFDLFCASFGFDWTLRNAMKDFMDSCIAIANEEGFCLALKSLFLSAVDGMCQILSRMPLALDPGNKEKLITELNSEDRYKAMISLLPKPSIFRVFSLIALCDVYTTELNTVNGREKAYHSVIHRLVKLVEDWKNYTSLSAA